jgi:O-antigen/teichoic acid export membrane protein
MIDKFRTVLASKLPPGSFIRNVVTLMTGTTFAQALMILVAPILTRLYSPEDFGVYALYTSILGIIAVIACWRYELAIVLPEQDEDAANLLVLSICICFGMAALTLILVALFRNPVANLLGAPELAPWLWFMPLSLIAAGLFQAFNYWSTRRKQFRRLAVRQITQSTVTAATQLGTGFALHPGPGGLISGSIIGQLAATGRLAWQTYNDDKKYFLVIKLWHIKDKFVEFRRFPQMLTWSGLLNTVSVQLPVILMSYFFGPSIIAHYVLGYRVLTVPMTLVGSSVAQTFFPWGTEAYRRGELGSSVIKISVVMFNAVLVPIVLIMICGPDLFTIIFGNAWRIAGEYIVWLSPWILFQFISSPLSSVFLILQRQDINLIFDGLLFLLRVVIIMIGGSLNNPLLTIQIYGITSALFYFIACIIVFKLTSVNYRVVLGKFLFILKRGTPYILIPVLIKMFCYIPILLLTVSVTCGFLFVLLTFRSTFIREVKD